MGKEFKVTVAGVAVTVATPKEAQKLLSEAGVKATLKDIMSGKQSQVTVVEVKDEAVKDEATNETATGEAASEVVTEEAPADDVTEAPQDQPEEQETVEETKEEPKAEEKAPAKPAATPANDDVEYPEVGHFADVKTMKRYVKKLTDAQLKDWCELEGATYKECEHESINRMRMAMAVKAIHFPDTAPKGGGKSKSKYSQYGTEELVEMALENDVEITGDNGDMRILRMRAIMALRAAGVIE